MIKSAASISLVLLLVPFKGAGQDAQSEQAAASAGRAAESRTAAAQEVRKFAFTFAGRPDVKLKLHEVPVLRYTNPLRGDVYSDLFVWTHEGRPEVVASVNSWYSPRRYLGVAVTSLSLEKLIGTREEQEIWRPRSAGIELRPVRGAAAPAGTPSQRLMQMGVLARQFTAEYQRKARYNEGGPLRLLSRPLYRYERTSDEVQDGALFALADGTSPQLNLVIESRRTTTGYGWLYALAPNNSVKYRVLHNDREVWSLPQLAPPWPNSKNPINTYTVFPDLQNEGRTRELAEQLRIAAMAQRESSASEPEPRED